MDLREAKERGFEEAVRHPWETARLEFVAGLIRRHVTLEPGAIVLDVGCGDTYVAEQLAARYRGVEFYAVDAAFTDDLLERYRTRLRDSRIMPFASLDAIDPPIARPVSLILLMDVIEHIEDATAFLTGLRGLPYVGPRTKLLITVPSYQSLFCSHDAFLGHYRRYSNRTLRKHVEESGLRVVDIGYFFSSLLPIRVLQVVRERLIGMKPERETSGLVTWHGSESSAAVMRNLLTLDARAGMLLRRLGLRMPGLSNYAICVKSA